MDRRDPATRDVASIETPSYYAVLPATVRYDKTLSPQARLLYAEITALAQKTGFCFATNTYLAALYDVRKEQASRWVSALEERGYIRTELVYREGSKLVVARRIYLTEVLRENAIPVAEKRIEGVAEKRKENNTRENNQKEAGAPAVFARSRRQSKANLDDGEFIELMRATFDWVNVDDELKKAAAYCVTKGRQFTRLFFQSSWLSNIRRDDTQRLVQPNGNGNGRRNTVDVVPAIHGKSLSERAAMAVDFDPGYDF